MERYHLTANGPALCRARKKPCPLGGEHYSDAEEALADWENIMDTEGPGRFVTLSKVTGDAPAPDHAANEASYKELRGRLWREEVDKRDEYRKPTRDEAVALAKLFIKESEAALETYGHKDERTLRASLKSRVAGKLVEEWNNKALREQYLVAEAEYEAWRSFLESEGKVSTTTTCSCGHHQSNHGNVRPYKCMKWEPHGAPDAQPCKCPGYVGANRELWETNRQAKGMLQREFPETAESLLGYETAGDRDFWLSILQAGLHPGQPREE